jgi:putative toxin-antitoxin system antitoxin component (TIGR02293 family)
LLESLGGEAGGRSGDRSTTVHDLVLALDRMSGYAENATISSGLPVRTWKSLQGVGLSRDEIARVVGASPKTIQRKEAQRQLLDVAEGDRTMRLLRVVVQAAETFGDVETALAWLRAPNTALVGKAPLEMVTTEAGTGLVRRALGVIEYGGVA